MKTTQRHRTGHCALLTALLAGLGVLNAFAQFTFQSGSTGTNGALNVTSNTTLALPSHGQFHYTTINVASNATLRFTTNALNTPVYLLAQGDVVINGTIDVSGAAGTTTNGGAGGPGGFPGGNPTNVVLGRPPGDGCGPGAGRAAASWAGFASYGTAASGGGGGSLNGATYGSALLMPLVGGSGGGGTSGWVGAGGSGGGGAILIGSSTSITHAGSVAARGTRIQVLGGGAGSGGAIRLVAPVVSGSGYLDVSGSDNLGYGGSGAGRIRVDCMLSGSVAFNFKPSSVASIGANMVVFPPNPPRLDITQVAGNDIPVGTNTPVFFMLPQDSPTNQTVTVQARNFSGQVPIRVVLTPDNGSSAYYDTNIDNSTINPASLTVPVVVPVNVRVLVNAWTR